MSDTEDSISSAPVQDGKKYSIMVPGGGALSVLPGKYKNEELWVAEANDGGFGFRNASSGKLLRANKNGDIAVDADKLDSWERFQFLSAGSGYLFWLIYKGTQQYLYRPAQFMMNEPLAIATSRICGPSKVPFDLEETNHIVAAATVVAAEKSPAVAVLTRLRAASIGSRDSSERRSSSGGQEEKSSKDLHVGFGFVKMVERQSLSREFDAYLYVEDGVGVTVSA
ncbi:hypothetical protein IFM5058_06455 [Aspergillus udagawae]|nr:hypothetical protein IFM5058_06455 [Aspergillus udagawae]